MLLALKQVVAFAYIGIFCPANATLAAESEWVLDAKPGVYDVWIVQADGSKNQCLYRVTEHSGAR